MDWRTIFCDFMLKFSYLCFGWQQKQSSNSFSDNRPEVRRRTNDKSIVEVIAENFYQHRSSICRFLLFLFIFHRSHFVILPLIQLLIFQRWKWYWKSKSFSFHEHFFTQKFLPLLNREKSRDCSLFHDGSLIN